MPLEIFVGNGAASSGLVSSNKSGVFSNSTSSPYTRDGYSISYNDSYGAGSGTRFDASRVVPTAEENRPVNMGVNIFIKINNEYN